MDPSALRNSCGARRPPAMRTVIGTGSTVCRTDPVVIRPPCGAGFGEVRNSPAYAAGRCRGGSILRAACPADGGAWRMAGERRGLLVSRGWVQAVILVVLIGFFVLGLLAYRTYQAKPPIPERVVDPAGELLYSGRDVERGQEVFLNNGLMEYGSVFGHGAYLGPDYTADYLRRSANYVRRSYGGVRSDRATQRTIEDFRTNRYSKRTGVLELTAPQAEAHRRLVGHYSRFFSEPATRNG